MNHLSAQVASRATRYKGPTQQNKRKHLMSQNFGQTDGFKK